MITQKEYDNLQVGDYIIDVVGYEMLVSGIYPPDIMVFYNGGEELYNITDIASVIPRGNKK